MACLRELLYFNIILFVFNSSVTRPAAAERNEVCNTNYTAEEENGRIADIGEWLMSWGFAFGRAGYGVGGIKRIVFWVDVCHSFSDNRHNGIWSIQFMFYMILLTLIKRMGIIIPM